MLGLAERRIEAGLLYACGEVAVKRVASATVRDIGGFNRRIRGNMSSHGGMS